MVGVVVELVDDDVVHGGVRAVAEGDGNERFAAAGEGNFGLVWAGELD